MKVVRSKEYQPNFSLSKNKERHSPDDKEHQTQGSKPWYGTIRTKELLSFSKQKINTIKYLIKFFEELSETIHITMQRIMNHLGVQMSQGDAREFIDLIVEEKRRKIMEIEKKIFKLSELKKASELNRCDMLQINNFMKDEEMMEQKLNLKEVTKKTLNKILSEVRKVTVKFQKITPSSSAYSVQNVIYQDQKQLTLLTQAQDKIDEFSIEVTVIRLVKKISRKMREKLSFGKQNQYYLYTVKDGSGSANVLSSKNPKLCEGNTVFMNKCSFIQQQKLIKVHEDSDFFLVSQNYLGIQSEREEGMEEGPQRREVDSEEEQIGLKRVRSRKFRQEKDELEIESKKIIEIEAGEQNLSVMGKIFHIQPLEKGSRDKMCKIGDKTGIVKVLLPKNHPLVKPWQCIHLLNFTASVINKSITLQMKENSSMRELPISIDSINYCRDVSKPKYI